MDSWSGGSANSSEEEQRLLMDQKKRKRMISNRESARRSRLKKQQQLGDLMAQVARLRKENSQILNGLSVTTQHYLNVEADNTILRAQAAELSSRLQFLNEIVGFLGSGNGVFLDHVEPAYDLAELNGFVNNSWNYFTQPMLMAAAPAESGFQH